jgi:hypothetical protein
VPENWVQHPVINTVEGTNPGAPLAWGSPENPDDVVAGYGYVAADTSEVEETFYYHSDHLGSTAYITDQKANVTQYDAYLPYGELLVDEHSSSADLPYKFNGKELDEETGLYYYGAKKEVYQKFCKLSHAKQNGKGEIRSAINAICFYENVEGVESKNYAVFNGIKADCWDGMDLVYDQGNFHTKNYIWSADSKRIIEKYISKVKGSNPNLKFKYSNKGSQGASSSAIGIVGFTVFQKLLSGHGEGKKKNKKTGMLYPVAE